MFSRLLDVLIDISPASDTLAKYGPVTDAVSTTPEPMVASVSRSKARKNVSTSLVNFAPASRLRLLPPGRKIPPASPVTSCSVPEHEINTRERNRKPAESPRAPNCKVAPALIAIRLNLILREPPSVSVESDAPGATKRPQSWDEHTSEVGVRPPNHVLLTVNEPV